MGVRTDSISAVLDAEERALEEDVTAAMRETSDFTKSIWREHIAAAGLPKRLGNTVRSLTYPKTGASLEPAGLVTTKAPAIMASLVDSIVIRPTGGRRYLAIPSENVPHKTARTLMTPVEVEASFNQDLIIRPSRNGRLLAFVNVIAARNKKGWRRATKGRMAQGRQSQLVLMFTLVPFVTTRKRLDLDAIATRGGAHFETALARIRGRRR